MGYWRGRPPFIWNSEELALFPAAGFHIIDGGAAGEIFEPFDAVLERCRIYAFEPRGGEAVEYEACVSLDAGLWSEPGQRTLHVAEHPKASSIYPPNIDYLARFPDRLGVPIRATAKKVDIAVTSVDTEVQNGTFAKPNFIKLDVHSAEYEALVGSSNSLDECLGLLIETWHAPIHAGQHLNGEIESWLYARGFQLFDSRPAALWPHGADATPTALERRQLVGSESLYLREVAPGHLWGQQLALMELFGYVALAIQRCDLMLSGELPHTARLDHLQAVRAALLANREARWESWRKERSVSQSHSREEKRRRQETKEERRQARLVAKEELRQARLVAKEELRQARLKAWRLERRQLKSDRREAIRLEKSQCASDKLPPA